MEQWLAHLVLAIPVGPDGIKFDGDRHNGTTVNQHGRPVDGEFPAQPRRQPAPRLHQPVCRGTRNHRPRARDSHQLTDAGRHSGTAGTPGAVSDARLLGMGDAAVAA